MQFQNNLAFLAKTFVGHRMGTNFFDMDIKFGKTDKKSLKRQPEHDNNEMDNETKKRKTIMSWILVL